MNEKATMARPAQKLNPIAKSSVGGSKLDQQIITGTLTSRIETKQEKISGKVYHYRFFKFPNQGQEIPVVFKDQKKTL